MQLSINKTLLFILFRILLITLIKKQSHKTHSNISISHVEPLSAISPETIPVSIETIHVSIETIHVSIETFPALCKPFVWNICAPKWCLATLKCVILRFANNADMIETPLRLIIRSGTWRSILTPAYSTMTSLIVRTFNASN